MPPARPTGLVSHAQNLEDVMLWRALGHVPAGFYVDVGAQDPRTDSVSRGFYERGWRGVHVEPSRHYAALLRADRPDETVIEAALGEHTGNIPFWEFAGTGLSTGSPRQVDTLVGQGRQPHETTVACLTLEAVLAPHAARDIHWLKIDAEGMEETVLRGWGDSAVRPWVVVVESTALDRCPNHHAWEPLVLSRGYTFAYFDELNRFYVSHAHPELLPAFSHPPCVFDFYTRVDTARALASCEALERRIVELDAHIAAHQKMLRAESSESRRLRSLIYTASAGTHFYRAWQVLCADDRYISDHPGMPGAGPDSAKDYANLRVSWHAHLCRALRTAWVRSRHPWHTHLYRAFESLKGNPKYRNMRTSAGV